MKISVFGLGYVGAVTALCFAKLGHDVIGIDINEKKVKMLNSGIVPVKEQGLDELLKDAIRNKNFFATTNAKEGILNSEVSFICVRTPLIKGEGLDTSEIQKVCHQIAKYLSKKKGKRHIIVIRSTVPPGTIAALEKVFIKHRLIGGKDFVLGANPEFLREGEAVKDFFEPGYVVIGCNDKIARDMLTEFYKEINAPIYQVSTETAETIKFVNNSWHALEICFVNEISSISKRLGINGKELIELFSSDTKLNLSPYYLRPNMGYGGSCLPKDLGALQEVAMKNNLKCDLLRSISKSNINQIKKSYDFVKNEAIKKKKRDIGIFGIAFKPGTDDLRGSPILYFIERFRKEGFTVKIYDPIIKKEQLDSIKNSYREIIYDPLLSEIMGLKKFNSLIERIEKMICPLDDVLASSVIIMNSKIPTNLLKKLREDQLLINTRAIIGLETREEIKAQYLEIW